MRFPWGQREDGVLGRRADDIPGETAEFWVELNDRDDLRDAFALLQERIRRYQRAGWPVPEAPRRRERSIVVECMAQSQGR